MSKKRDRLRVIFDILDVIREKGETIKPTHILYKSNLSHQMMQQYLNELIGKGFLIERVTEKGKNYSLNALHILTLLLDNHCIQIQDTY